MADDFIMIDESNVEDDALRSAIKSYKEAMRRPAQDLDVEYLIKTLKYINSSSPIKVACNPVDRHREWISGTPLYNVGKIYVDEDHHLTLRMRSDNTEFSAEKMLEKIAKLKKNLHGLKGPVMLELPDGKKVKLTDAFSHAFVKTVWAGMPFDLVLGYFDANIEVNETIETTE